MKSNRTSRFYLILIFSLGLLLAGCFSSSSDDNGDNGSDDNGSNGPDDNGDNATFALQVVDYRNEDGDTGYITIRHHGLDGEVNLEEEDENGGGPPTSVGTASEEGLHAHLPGRYVHPAEVEDKYGELANINASEGWAHVNLEQSKVVDPEEEHWHLKFNRFNVRLNSGPSGNGEVHGALGLQPPKELYGKDDEGDTDFDSPKQDAFTAAEPHQHIARLIDNDFSDPGSSVSDEWQADRLVSAIGDEFWETDTSGGMPPDIVANKDVGWLVRGRDGETYARIRVTDLLFEMTGDTDFEYEITMNIAEKDGDGKYPFDDNDEKFEGTLDRNDGGEACFDFVDKKERVECSGDDWDLLVYWDGTEGYQRGMGGELMGILLNGGTDREGEPRDGDAAVIGPMPPNTQMGWDDGDVDDEGNGLGQVERADEISFFDSPRAVHQDQPGGLFDDYPWHELLSMEIDGGPVWPNYRVYLIKDKAANSKD
ncbi:HmuY family protein [Halorhodospira halochloris]|uniref:HmuY family protein n=1 Tax=Halorhodospira halochloris TaxID=1052 RepID=UPI001EE8FAEC|nr:HmuY family protein [Halorhodospira halochloris]MCG5549420.1 HmuY family protein [Halorhodospira halochloris]